MLVHIKHGICRAVCAMLAVGITALVSCEQDGEVGLLGYQDRLERVSVKWEYGGTEYEGSVILEEGVPPDAERYRSAYVNISSPAELDGVSVEYSPDAATVSVGEISFAMPEDAANTLYTLVRSLSLYKSEMKGAGSGGAVTAVSFETAVGGVPAEYNIVYGDEKYPLSAEVTWDGEMKMKIGYGELILREVEGE